MDYQLVLQFQCADDDDDLYSDILELEDHLTDLLESQELAELDGHDFGGGEINLFIHTEQPEAIYKQIGPALTPFQKKLKVAFRQSDSDEYTVLFPEGLKQFQIK